MKKSNRVSKIYQANFKLGSLALKYRNQTRQLDARYAKEGIQCRNMATGRKFTMGSSGRNPDRARLSSM
jgi:hypothetical protein